jgi:hypothetical protein
MQPGFAESELRAAKAMLRLLEWDNELNPTEHDEEGQGAASVSDGEEEEVSAVTQLMMCFTRPSGGVAIGACPVFQQWCSLKWVAPDAPSIRLLCPNSVMGVLIGTTDGARDHRRQLRRAAVGPQGQPAPHGGQAGPRGAWSVPRDPVCTQPGHAERGEAPAARDGGLCGAALRHHSLLQGNLAAAMCFFEHHRGTIMLYVCKSHLSVFPCAVTDVLYCSKLVEDCAILHSVTHLSLQLTASTLPLTRVVVTHAVHLALSGGPPGPGTAEGQAPQRHRLAGQSRPAPAPQLGE